MVLPKEEVLTGESLDLKFSLQLSTVLPRVHYSSSSLLHLQCQGHVECKRAVAHVWF